MIKNITRIQTMDILYKINLKKKNEMKNKDLSQFLAKRTTIGLMQFLRNITKYFWIQHKL